jgi:hypothetical protein
MVGKPFVRLEVKMRWNIAGCHAGNQRQVQVIVKDADAALRHGEQKDEDQRANRLRPLCPVGPGFFQPQRFSGRDQTANQHQQRTHG